MEVITLEHFYLSLQYGYYVTITIPLIKEVFQSFVSENNNQDDATKYTQTKPILLIPKQHNKIFSKSEQYGKMQMVDQRNKYDIQVHILYQFWRIHIISSLTII